MSAPIVQDNDKKDMRPSHMNRWVQKVSDIHLGNAPRVSIDSDDSPSQQIPDSVPLSHLLRNNAKWAKRMTSVDPEFFSRLAKQQKPQILWIGCSDSRVPANQIVDLAPGEVFVHRNVGNVITHSDFNALSVIQYAVDVLGVQHIIVCGHYGCGAISSAAGSKQLGLIDNWLRNIKDVYSSHYKTFQDSKKNHPNGENSPEAHNTVCDLLCELNVAKSVANVCATTIVQNAWDRGQKLSVHGWCYRLTDGYIRNLNLCLSSTKDFTDSSSVFSMIGSKLTPEA